MNALERPLPETIGRYRIVRLLGQGAMGRVLLAHDPVLDRSVAVKLLRDDLSLPPEHRLALLERMRQEARASARVSHPNIVALHDMGEDPGLGLFLVFEYVEGATLKERLTRGPLGPEASARLARELGDALSTAHGAGVLHRDIKPENVILARHGAKIADFGIARVPDSTLTRDGGLLGTPAYSAPEAIASASFSSFSDQFSMAATLYEAISMRRAFPGDDAVAVATRIANQDPERISELCNLDPHVDSVLFRALNKNVQGRFESCEIFGRALAEALELTPRSAQPTLPDEKHLETSVRPADVGTGTRRTRIVIGAVGVALLAGVAGAPFLFAEERAPSPPLAAVALEGGAATGNPPIGYLAERPSDKKSRRSAQAASEESRTSMSDAGTLGQDAANEPDAATRKVPAAAEGSRDASPAAAPANSNDPSASPR